MEHWQEHHKCSVCKREMIIDVISRGTLHQSIAAITCKECAEKTRGIEYKDIV